MGLMSLLLVATLSDHCRLMQEVCIMHFKCILHFIFIITPSGPITFISATVQHIQRMDCVYYGAPFSVLQFDIRGRRV